MSGWEFDYMGEFGSQADADRWAKRNGIAFNDVRTCASGSGVKLEIRRSALGDDGKRRDDLRDGRRLGW